MLRSKAKSKSATGLSLAKRPCSCSQCRGAQKQTPSQIRHHLQRDQRNASYEHSSSSTFASVSSVNSALQGIPATKRVHDDGAQHEHLPMHPKRSEPAGTPSHFAPAQQNNAHSFDIPMTEAHTSDTADTLGDAQVFPFAVWAAPGSFSPHPTHALLSPSMSFAIPAAVSRPSQPLSQALEMKADMAPLATFVPPPLPQDPPTASSSRGPWLQDEHSVPISMTSADVLAALEHVEQQNTVAATKAVPLTAHAAHSDPLTKTEKRMTRSMMRMLEAAQRALQEQQAEAEASSGSGTVPTGTPNDGDEQPDVDAGFEEAEDDDDDNDGGDDGVEIRGRRSTASRVLHPWTDETPVVDEPTEVPCDEPDPFYSGPAEEVGSGDALVDQHDVLLSIQSVVTWLSTRHSLARVACTTLLWFFGALLLVLGFGSLSRELPKTLGTVHRRLGTDPPIVLLPTCSICQTVYPRTRSLTACPRCNNDLYRNLKSSSRIPVRKYPTHALEPQLRALLARPGMAGLLDGWRTLPRSPETMQDIFDGDVARKLKAPDGSLFFRNTPEDRLAGPDGELRIGVTLGLDWYVTLHRN